MWETALAMIKDELDRQPILPGQRSVRDRRAQRQVPVSNLQPSRRPEKARAAQSRMALRASPRQLALAPPTHPWSIPLAARSTSGERVERGASSRDQAPPLPALSSAARKRGSPSCGEGRRFAPAIQIFWRGSVTFPGAKGLTLRYSHDPKPNLINHICPPHGAPRLLPL